MNHSIPVSVLGPCVLCEAPLDSASVESAVTEDAHVVTVRCHGEVRSFKIPGERFDLLPKKFFEENGPKEFEPPRRRIVL